MLHIFCSSQKCRYFSLAEEPSTSLSSDGPTAPGVDNGEPVQPATTAAPSPPSVREILQSLSSARARGEGSETIAKILKEAIQTHKTSEVGLQLHMCSQFSNRHKRLDLSSTTTSEGNYTQD